MSATRSATRAQNTGLDALEARLGHIFRDRALLVQALTHLSAVGAASTPDRSYQRLEFLGDRVLGLVVADMLCASFPRANEGELSRRLAGLVRRETCAEVALAWGVDAHVRLGEAEAQSGGRGKAAILADVCEAVIGAVFRDGGFAAASALVQGSWAERMHMPRLPLRDGKTSLQEWAQGRGLPTPAYSEVARSGPPHAPAFVVSVAIPGFAEAEGSGTSKRAAEQAAAAAFIAREGIGGAEERE